MGNPKKWGFTSGVHPKGTEYYLVYFRFGGKTLWSAYLRGFGNYGWWDSKAIAKGHVEKIIDRSLEIYHK